MRFKNIAITILIAVACMTVAVWARPGQSTPKTQQWEYKMTSGVSESDLNKLGEQGWELTGIQRNFDNNGATYFFKRPRN